MSPSEAHAVLDTVEADNCAALYKARCNSAAAKEIVPRLTTVLGVGDRDIVLRVLRALTIIGPPACDAAPSIATLLKSSEIWVFQAAAIALARVSLKSPQNAVKPLVDSANVFGGEKHVMLALIDLGNAAKSAYPVFLRALESRSADMRRLALRGLLSIGAPEEVLTAALAQAAADKSKKVREYASNASALQ